MTWGMLVHKHTFTYITTFLISLPSKGTSHPASDWLTTVTRGRPAPTRPAASVICLITMFTVVKALCCGTFAHLASIRNPWKLLWFKHFFSECTFAYIAPIFISLPAKWTCHTTADRLTVIRGRSTTLACSAATVIRDITVFTMHQTLNWGTSANHARPYPWFWP